MAIQYSGNTQTSTFSPASKQDIINNVGAALVTAGWTTVSGGTGTTAWKLQSAATPQGYAIRVLMKDNGGNCITFSLESSDGTLAGGNSTTVGCFLIPGGYTYKMVLCKYQCFVYAIPYSSAARTFVAFGVPAVLSFLTGGISRLGWLEGNAISDTDTGTARPCLRNTVCIGAANVPASQAHINAYLWSDNSNGRPAGFPLLLQTVSFNGNDVSFGWRFFNGAAVEYDAVIGWGTTSVNDEQLFNGQLWDAVCTADVYTADSSATLSDGHNYTTMQGSALGGQSRGTLCLAVS